MGLFLPPIAAGVTSAKWGAFDMGVRQPSLCPASACCAKPSQVCRCSLSIRIPEPLSPFTLWFLPKRHVYLAGDCLQHAHFDLTPALLPLGQVTLWMMGEFGFSIEKASLCFTCASLAFVTCSPINGAIGDKIPKHTMKRMIITVSWLRMISFCVHFRRCFLPRARFNRLS